MNAGFLNHPKYGFLAVYLLFIDTKSPKSDLFVPTAAQVNSNCSCLARTTRGVKGSRKFQEGTFHRIKCTIHHNLVNSHGRLKMEFGRHLFGMVNWVEFTWPFSSWWKVTSQLWGSSWVTSWITWWIKVEPSYWKPCRWNPLDEWMNELPTVKQGH